MEVVVLAAASLILTKIYLVLVIIICPITFGRIREHTCTQSTTYYVKMFNNYYIIC